MTHIHIHTQSCQDLKSRLSEFVDGELDDGLCQEIQRHLQDCDKCRIVVDTLKKTIALYRDSPDETVPADVHARLVQVLDLETQKEKK